MIRLKLSIAFIAILAMLSFSTHRLEAVSYVTDTGGYAYDESRAAVNLAPAIALGTVVIVAIIAIAVQNSHAGSSSHCHSHCDCCSSSSSCCSSSSSCSCSS